jgi:hypothetical protein
LNGEGSRQRLLKKKMRGLTTVKKIDLYKTSRGKKQKTINDVANELEKRLDSQGLKPDSSSLSEEFKKIKGDPFPLHNNISGMIWVNVDKVTATLSVKDSENPEAVKGRMLTVQYKMQEGKAAEAFEKATNALKIMMESFWIDIEEELKQSKQEQQDTKEQASDSNNSSEENKLPQIQEGASAKEVAKSIQKALSDPDVAKEYESLQKTADSEEPVENQEQPPKKTITISTGAEALTDEKIVNQYKKQDTEKETRAAGQESSTYQVNRENESQNASSSSSLKDQLIKVDFTPEQAEVVIQLLEENQKKYEPKSSMFTLLGNTLGKMVHALGQKLEESIDAEKVINQKLDSIYSAINNENYEQFKEKFTPFEQKIKYCHDLISEAAQGESIQSTNIINHILNREKVPVSIRTLHNAFSVAIDHNVESALTLYRYADENLHGEAHAETMRGFINYALDALPEDTAERFIKASSSRTFDDTTLLKETIRAGKYNLFNSCLNRCENPDELAPSLYYFAAQRKDADAMHILKSIGTDINANHGEALYVCFEENKLDTAKLLINYGADIEALDKRINQIMKTNSVNLTDKNFDFLNQLYDHCKFNSKAEVIDEEVQSEELGG